MENVPQQVSKRTNPALWIVLAIVVTIAVVGFIYYWQTTNSNTNMNVANANAEANANTVNSSRVQIQRVDDHYLISSSEFSLEVPGNWYTTERSKGRSLFTASNENTDSILGLRNGTTGVVMDLVIEDHSGTLTNYLETHPVNVGSLVEQKAITVGSQSGFSREVDSTNTTATESSYSLLLLTKDNGTILEILFVSTTKDGIDANRQAIDRIARSLKLL